MCYTTALNALRKRNHCVINNLLELQRLSATAILLTIIPTGERVTLYASGYVK